MYKGGPIFYQLTQSKQNYILDITIRTGFIQFCMKKRYSRISHNLLISAVLLASPNCLKWQDGLLFLHRSQDAKSKWYAPISLAMAYILQHGSMHLYVEDSIKQMHLSVWCCKKKTSHMSNIMAMFPGHNISYSIIFQDYDC